MKCIKNPEIRSNLGMTSLFCVCVKLRDVIPVDDVEERLDVIRATVLIVQVVRVLPNIETEDWLNAFHDR